ncbi:hypothetical protein FQN57_002622 [Myotisia sp. PD_48]|nr:hypothetical protein FQN57_002622 [Myotisia sp. PD_48]
MVVTHETSTKYSLHSRLSIDGELCTIAYIGDVNGTRGQWLGVEWDDPTRGKHSGEHQGEKYFQSAAGKSNLPTAGSFVRPGRAVDQPLGFLEAIREKYASETPTIQHGPKTPLAAGSSNHLLEIGGKIVEEVGFEIVRRQLATLHELQNVIIDGFRVNGILPHDPNPSEQEKELENIKATCPAIIHLDLSRNLLCSWKEVSDICNQLGRLRTLKLAGNRFKAVDTQLIVSSTVTDLSLDQTLMTWNEISILSYLFPSLNTLSLSSNQLSCTSAPIALTIKELTLKSNQFKSLDSLRDLAKLPALQRLSLRGNKISKIRSLWGSDIVFSSSLTFVDLSRNEINSWETLEALHFVFPGMTHLRISDNPLYNNPPVPTEITGLPERQMTVDETYMLTLARLPILKILNYGKISPQDRFNGELYYISLVRKELLVSSSSGAEQQILARHPRYQQLCEIYGTSDIKSLKQNQKHTGANLRSLAARLVKFEFYLPAMQNSMLIKTSADKSQDSTLTGEPLTTLASVFEIEIPRTFDVYRIKTIVGRHFSLPPLRFKLIWETNEWDPLESGVILGDEWDSEEECKEAPGSPRNVEFALGRADTQFIRRDEELFNSTREVGHWFSSDTLDARPKYWCKHCKTYVRDTPYERNQHDATGKHQGNLKRFLRDVHRNQDRNEREIQVAKDEVQRLKGLVSEPRQQQPPPPRAALGKNASADWLAEERRQQVSQLANMGVSVPDEFRPDMAMAGEWKVVNERMIDEKTGKPSKEGGDAPISSLGVRKRNLHDEEQEEETGNHDELALRKPWRSVMRRYPPANGRESGNNRDDELDALLSMTTGVKNKFQVKIGSKSTAEDEGGDGDADNDIKKVKVEVESEDETTPDANLPDDDMPAKARDLESLANAALQPTCEAQLRSPRDLEDSAKVMFKKRKPKNMKR